MHDVRSHFKSTFVVHSSTVDELFCAFEGFLEIEKKRVAENWFVCAKDAVQQYKSTPT